MQRLKPRGDVQEFLGGGGLPDAVVCAVHLVKPFPRVIFGRLHGNQQASVLTGKARQRRGARRQTDTAVPEKQTGYSRAHET